MATSGADKSDLSSVFISHELPRRPPRRSDPMQEKLALHDLAARMDDDPETVLPRFVDLAMELTDGISAGLSLLEETPELDTFRWHCLRGVLAPFEGTTTPRHFSPCGVTLAESAPTLTRHSEVAYDWIADTGVSLPEVLLVPLYFAGPEPMGTLWIVSDKEEHFDSGDVRAITELAKFVGMVLRRLRNEKALRNALAEQETLADELSHRVKNLFSMINAFVRITGKSASSVGQMTEQLSGRFAALATAHALLRGSFSVGGSLPERADLGALVLAIVAPYQPQDGEGRSRFSIEGASVGCGEHAANGLALIFHELATNAAKYGALATDDGTIDIIWSDIGDRLIVRWLERGGPEIDGAPASKGFGSALADRTIVKQFGGKLAYEWGRAGLGVTITVPLAQLSR